MGTGNEFPQSDRAAKILRGAFAVLAMLWTLGVFADLAGDCLQSGSHCAGVIVSEIFSAAVSLLIGNGFLLIGYAFCLKLLESLPGRPTIRADGEKRESAGRDPPFGKGAAAAIQPGAFVYCDTYAWRNFHLHSGPSRREASRIASVAVLYRKRDVEIDADSVCGHWNARLSPAKSNIFGAPKAYEGTFSMEGKPLGGIWLEHSITDALVRIDFGGDTVSLWREKIRNPSSDLLAIVASGGPVARRFCNFLGPKDWWHTCFCEKMKCCGRWEFDSSGSAWKEDPKLLAGVLFAFALEMTTLEDVCHPSDDFTS